MEFQAYLSFLESMRQEMESLIQVEQDKIQAVQSGNLEKLAECMKEEQAAALALRGKEQRRAAILQELGVSKGSVRDLPEVCPAPLRSQAREVTERLLRTYEVLSSAQSTARTLMESELHRINQQMKRQGLDPELEEHYSPSTARDARTDFRA